MAPTFKPPPFFLYDNTSVETTIDEILDQQQTFPTLKEFTAGDFQNKVEGDQLLLIDTF